MPRTLLGWALAAAIFTPPSAFAAACWDKLNALSTDASFNSPRFANVRAATLLVEQLIRENPSLIELPEVRGQMRRDVGLVGTDKQPRTVAVFSGMYGRHAWSRSECGVIYEADRVPDSHVALVNVHINDLHFLKAAFWADSRVAGFVEPDVLGRFGKFPLYGYLSDYAHGAKRTGLSGTLTISKDERKPWRKMTYREYLDLIEKDARHKNSQPQKPSPNKELDEAKIQKMYESMKRFDPAQAESLRAKLLAQMAEARDPNSKYSRNRAQAETSLATRWEDELRKISELRTKLGPSGLDSQARTGAGPRDYPAGVAEPQDSRALPLAVFDETFWDVQNKDRVQLFTVDVSGLVGESKLTEVLEGLQVERLEAQLR